MKKLVAFLMALGMVLAIIPIEDTQARGRGGRGGRGGGISGSSRSRRSGKSRDKKLQELRDRRKLEDEDSLLRDRTWERRNRMMP